MKLYQHYQIVHPNELAEKESGMSYVREYIKYLCKAVKFFLKILVCWGSKKCSSDHTISQKFCNFAEPYLCKFLNCSFLQLYWFQRHSLRWWCRKGWLAKVKNWKNLEMVYSRSYFDVFLSKLWHTAKWWNGMMTRPSPLHWT